MGAESLREHLSRMLDGWGYDFARFEISDFSLWVADRRGRRIRLVPMPLPPELFGAWIEGDKTDYIFYEADPLHVHSVHIILHELCHILLGHKTAHVGRDVSELFGASSDIERPETQQALTGLFRDVTHTDLQEMEAETLSSLIQHRVFRLTGLAALTHASRNPELRQVVASLGFDR